MTLHSDDWSNQASSSSRISTLKCQLFKRSGEQVLRAVKYLIFEDSLGQLWYLPPPRLESHFGAVERAKGPTAGCEEGGTICVDHLGLRLTHIYTHTLLPLLTLSIWFQVDNALTQIKKSGYTGFTQQSELHHTAIHCPLPPTRYNHYSYYKYLNNYSKLYYMH